jgi:hypothetical protein
MLPEQRAGLIEALAARGSCEVRVEGRSMLPFIKPGDVVTIKRCKGSQRIGSIVALFVKDQLIVHRVVKVTKTDTLLISGDSSAGSEASVMPSEIIGTVVSLKRNGKIHSRWLQRPLSLIALIVGMIIKMLVRA